MLKYLVAAAALSAMAGSASAATIIIDTGINPSAKAYTRPVNGDTVLLGQFALQHGSIIDQILAYGRVVTSGTAFFGLYANNANNTPVATPIYRVDQFFSATLKPNYYGVGGTTEDTSLNWQVAAGTYWVGVGQAVQGNSFTSTIRGDAPNPLGLEGSFKPKGYVATNSANLSWRLSGHTIAAEVPEPSTWAMMLLGFGMIGGVIRAKRLKPKVTYALA